MFNKLQIDYKTTQEGFPYTSMFVKVFESVNNFSCISKDLAI